MEDIKQEGTNMLATARELLPRAQEGMDRAREELTRVDETVRNFARQNPFAAIAGALAAGFVMGRLGSKL